MNRLIPAALLLAVLLALGSAIYLVAPALAEGEIAVVSNTHQNKFPNEIIFKLQARGSGEIKRVTLFYKFKSSEASSYAYPQFTPKTEISTEWSYDIKKGYIPPGTDVTYYWQIEDAAGNQTKTEPITFTYEDNRFKWQAVSQGAISIHYYREESRAKDLLEGAVEAVRRESSQLRVSYTRPMKLYVYETRDDMREALPKKSETYDARTTTLGVRLSPEVLLLLGSQSGVKETMFHEIMHMIVAEAAEGPYSEIPSWLNEGLAMWAEGELGPEHQRALNRAVRDGTLISVRSLTSYTGDPAQVNLFYAESESVVQYLIDSYGIDKMADLMAVFKQGSTTDKALTKVYSFTTDELDARWRVQLGAPASQRGGSQSRGAQPGGVPTLVPFGSQPQGAAQSSRDIGLAGAGAGVVVVAAAAGLLYRRRRRAS